MSIQEDNDDGARCTCRSLFAESIHEGLGRTLPHGSQFPRERG